MNDLRILRDRHADLDDDLDRSTSSPPDATRSAIVQTKTVTTYPTSASAYYAVVLVEIDGTELEGASASFTAGTDVFYAYNVGTAIPDTGTNLVAHNLGGRWCFRHD